MLTGLLLVALVVAATALAHLSVWECSVAVRELVDDDLSRLADTCRIADYAARCYRLQKEFELNFAQRDARRKTLDAWRSAWGRLNSQPAKPEAQGASIAGRPVPPDWNSRLVRHRREFLEVVRQVESGTLHTQAAVHDAIKGCDAIVLQLANDADALAEQQLAQARAGRDGLHRLVKSHVRLINARGVAAILVIMIAMVWFQRKVLSRLRDYADTARRLAAGDLHGRLDPCGGDELGVLAAQVNEMAAALQANCREAIGAGAAARSADHGATDAVAPQQKPAETLPADPAPPGLRVLLTEDGPENRRLLSYLLEKAGAEVTAATNGLEAVEAVLGGSAEADPTGRPARTFDLVLMDMQMPVMDGYEATRRLRQHGYRGSIVAVTGHTKEYDCQKCLEAGCDDYLPKPVDRDRLLALVAKQATRRAAQARLTSAQI